MSPPKDRDDVELDADDAVDSACSGEAPVTSPAIVLADHGAVGLTPVEDELRRRYADDYLIVSETSAARALRGLEAFKAAGQPVAVVLAGSSMSAPEAEGFLAAAHRLHPAARRGLLVSRGGPHAPRLRVPIALLRDRSAALPILRGMALGMVDAYLPVPGAPPDEGFHRSITELLDEWAREGQASPPAVQIVGDVWSLRAHRLRDVFDRNGIPYTFHAADSEHGGRLLERAGEDGSSLPILVMYTGQVLADPTDRQIAESFALATPPMQVMDVAIVGAGPAGLSAAVYTASEGLSTLLLEREAIGGQAGSSSRIRNYLGFPRGVSGAELATRAFEQAWLFGALPCVTPSVTGLHRSDRHYVLTLGEGGEVAARSVVIATGVSYRTLDVANADAFAGAGIFYGAATSEAAALVGQLVFVAGGGNSAGQAAVHLAKYAEQVTILVRRDSLADTMSEYLITQISATPNIVVRYRTQVVAAQGSGRLEALVVADATTGTAETMPAAALFVLIGATPHTAWLPDAIARDRWGFVVTGSDLVSVSEGEQSQPWPLTRPPTSLETNLPGVFAAGDVRHQSVKRVASAVGEGAIASMLVAQFLQDQATAS